MGPVNGVSEDRVKVLLNLGFAEYEREVGNPRHKENTRKLDSFKEVLDEMNDSWQQLKGALLFAKVIGSVVAFLCMAILALLSYLATHHTTSQLSVQSPTTVAQSIHSSIY